MQIPNDIFSVENLVCDESFQRYCLGSNLEDQILWKERMAQHPEHQVIFAEAQQLVNLLSLNQGSRLHQLKDLRMGIKQRESLQRSLVATADVDLRANAERTKPRKIYQYIGGVAAAIAIIVSFYLMYNPGLPDPQIRRDQNQVMQIITSGSAIRKTVLLTDGTVITLGKESSIELRKQFDAHKRELWLKGEAFFDVKHDPTSPFTVHTPFDEVKVLGTTFNVKAYPDSQAMETSLIKGRVQVNSMQYLGYSVILKPNQKLISNKVYDLSTDNNPKAHYKVSALKNTGSGGSPVEIKWAQNRLDIDNQPLSVIANKLQNWYGIAIVIRDNQVKDYRYSGIFENETIIKTLEALQLSYPFTFKVEQDRIVISK